MPGDNESRVATHQMMIAQRYALAEQRAGMRALLECQS